MYWMIRSQISRSKHTDPLPIRERRRLHSPWKRRSAGGLSQRQKTGRLLKERGINSRPFVKALGGEPIRPRIILQAPRSGFLHPAGRSDVPGALELIGPEACGAYSVDGDGRSRTPSIRSRRGGLAVTHQHFAVTSVQSLLEALGEQELPKEKIVFWK